MQNGEISVEIMERLQEQKMRRNKRTNESTKKKTLQPKMEKANNYISVKWSLCVFFCEFYFFFFSDGAVIIVARGIVGGGFYFIDTCAFRWNVCWLWSRKTKGKKMVNVHIRWIDWWRKRKKWKKGMKKRERIESKFGIFEVWYFLLLSI